MIIQAKSNTESHGERGTPFHDRASIAQGNATEETRNEYVALQETGRDTIESKTSENPAASIILRVSGAENRGL